MQIMPLSEINIWSSVVVLTYISSLIIMMINIINVLECFILPSCIIKLPNGYMGVLIKHPVEYGEDFIHPEDVDCNKYKLDM